MLIFRMREAAIGKAEGSSAMDYVTDLTDVSNKFARFVSRKLIITAVRVASIIAGKSDI